MRLGNALNNTSIVPLFAEEILISKRGSPWPPDVGPHDFLMRVTLTWCGPPWLSDMGPMTFWCGPPWPDVGPYDVMQASMTWCGPLNLMWPPWPDVGPLNLLMWVHMTHPRCLDSTTSSLSNFHLLSINHMPVSTLLCSLHSGLSLSACSLSSLSPSTLSSVPLTISSAHLSSTSPPSIFSLFLLFAVFLLCRNNEQKQKSVL